MITIVNALPLGVLALVIARRVLYSVFSAPDTYSENVSTQVRSYRSISCQSSAGKARKSASLKLDHKTPCSTSTPSLNRSSSSYCKVPPCPAIRRASAEDVLPFPRKKISLNCPGRRPDRPCASDRHNCFPGVVPRPGCRSDTCTVSFDKHAGCAQLPTCQPPSGAGSSKSSFDNLGKKRDNHCTCILFGPCQCRNATECLPICTAEKTLSGITSSKITFCSSKGGEYTCSQPGVRVGCICDQTKND